MNLLKTNCRHALSVKLIHTALHSSEPLCSWARLFIPEPDAFFVRKMMKFIIIFHFVSTLYYERSLGKERQQAAKGSSNFLSMFPKINKVPRAHVERWISGVEGVFQ